MPFGQTLRAAREAKGLSTSELAAQTHLLVQVVEGLENEDFRRIPAPIYGRGFVKLYCETVGLDPKQIIEIRNLIRTLGKDHTVILSTHILQEVQAVCDRIIIMNKGKIVADEKTENITRAVQNNRRFNVKICGPQREVLNLLRSKPGIVYAEVLAERDGDAYTYMIESDYGVDIRKNLFFALAEKGWPLIGLESLGMNLEDVFISVVDNSNEIPMVRERAARNRGSSKGKTRGMIEKTVAADLVQSAEQKRKEDSLSYDESGDDD